MEEEKNVKDMVVVVVCKKRPKEVFVQGSDENLITADGE